MGKPDFLVADHGTIFLLTAATEQAREWADQNLPEDRTEFGNAIVVEHRYIGDIVEGAVNDGLTVRAW